MGSNGNRISIEEIAKGNPYGKWTVLREASQRGYTRYAVVRCKCGFESEVGLASLRRGASKGCRSCADRSASGARRISIDEVVAANPYGKLTVLSEAPRGKWREMRVNCRCECGVEKVIDWNGVRQRLVTSCGGCRRRTSDKDQVAKSAYRDARSRRPKGFSLSMKNVREIIFDTKCRYCGANPETKEVNKVRADGTRPSHPAHTIDRLDSSKGYTRENSVPACWTCNEMKMARTEDEFIEACKRVAAFRG